MSESSSFYLEGGAFYPTSPGIGNVNGAGTSAHFTVWTGQTTVGDAGPASPSLLDALTGFSSMGVLQRTGVGAYAFLPTNAANGLVLLNGSGILPALNASLLTNLASAALVGALPALNAASLTNLTSANLVGALPAISGAALTNLTSANLVGALPALDGGALTDLTPVFLKTQAIGSGAVPISTFGQTYSTAAAWLEVNTTFPFGPYTWFMGQGSQGAILCAEHSAAFNPASFTTTDMITSVVYFVHDDTTVSPLYTGGWANYWVAQRNADASPNILVSMLEASYVNLGSTQEADPYNVSYPGITNSFTLDSGVGVEGTFLGTISGTTLTAASVTGRIFKGYPIHGAAAGTYIVQQLTGTTNGAGTYQVSVSQTVSTPTAMVARPNTATTAIQVSSNLGDFFNALRVTCNAVALAGSGYYEAIQLASQPTGSAGGGHAIVWYAGIPGTPGTVSAAIECNTSGQLVLDCAAGVKATGAISAGGTTAAQLTTTGNFTVLNDPAGGVASIIFLGNASSPSIDYRSTAHNWQDITGATTRMALDSSGNLNTTGVYQNAGTQVVSTRKTGWTVATGTASRATYATSSVTLATLAGVVMALEQDLIAHGLIGT